MKCFKANVVDVHECPNAKEGWCSHPQPFVYRGAWATHIRKCHRPVDIKQFVVQSEGIGERIGTLATWVRDLIVKVETLEGKIVSLEKYLTDEARPAVPTTKYEKRRKPTNGNQFLDFSEAEFVEALPEIVRWYKGTTGYELRGEGAAYAITTCMYFMNQQTRVIRTKEIYPKELGGTPRYDKIKGKEKYFDVCEKGRWWNRVPRTQLMKRFHEHPWVPRWETVGKILGGECENWNFFANNLKKKVFSDDFGWTSWTTKYQILELSARYEPPVSQQQQCEIWYQQECGDSGADWVARCTTAEQICGGRQQKFAGSHSFRAACAKAQLAHPDWPLLALLNEGREFWDLEPIAELSLGGCAGGPHGELEDVED